MNDETHVRDDALGEALRRLPVEPPSPAFFPTLSRRLREEALEVLESPSATRAPRSRRALLAVAALALVSAGIGGIAGASVTGSLGATEESPETTPRAEVVSFHAAEGWNTIQTDIGRASPWPVAWAANVPFQNEETYTGTPTNTLRNLPSNGIIIVASGPRIYEGGTSFPRRELPLRIEDGIFRSDTYETQPAPNVSMVIIDTWIGDELLNVHVWFGQNEPTRSLIDAANAQLARLAIPTE